MNQCVDMRRSFTHWNKQRYKKWIILDFYLKTWYCPKIRLWVLGTQRYNWAAQYVHFFFLFVKMKTMRKHCLMSHDWQIFSFSERGAHHRREKKKILLVWEKVVHTSRHSMCLSVFSLRNEWRSKRTMWEVAEKPKRASTVAAETFLTGLFPHKMDQQPKPIWLNSNPVI